MIREVITYPNKLLRLKSKDVEQFDTELHTLLDDMYDTIFIYQLAFAILRALRKPWN